MIISRSKASLGWRLGLASLACAVLPGGCGDRSASGEEENLVGPTLPPTTEGIAFTVPGERASYRLLRWSRLSNRHIDAMQRQDSRYGTIVSRMEIDCDARRYRVLGEGENEDQVRQQYEARAPGEWDDLVSGSIRDVTVTVACR